jgi:Tfp pilus assembly protein PilN
MIEINLLPAKLKKAKQMQVYYVYAGLAGSVIVIIALSMLWMQQQKIAEVDKEIRRIDAQSEALKDKIAMVQQFRSMEETYTKKKEIVDKLLIEQSVWTEALDRIGAMLPQDVWLLVLAETKAKEEGNQIQVDGFAVSRSIVADFVKEIEKSGAADEVKVVNMVEERRNNRDVVKFVISFLYRSPLKQAAVPQANK